MFVRTNAILALILVIALPSSNGIGNNDNKKEDSNRHVSKNRGLTAFYLLDPNDGMCLGPHGFTVCDVASLWLYAYRNDGEGHSLVSFLEPDPSQSCLSWRKFSYDNNENALVLMAQGCAKQESKHWVLEGPNKLGYFRLRSDLEPSRNDKRKYCVTRYKAGGSKSPGPRGRIRNVASMQPCEKRITDPIDFESGYIPLDITETAIHDAGFYLKTVDGYCFDGAAFRKCEMVEDVLWGVSLHFNHKGDIERSLFRFHNTKQPTAVHGLCIAEGSIKKSFSLGLDSCDSTPYSRRWGLKNGRLSRENGRICLVRLLDNSAAMRPCHEAFEYISMEVPEEAEKARKQSAQYHKKVLKF